MDLTTMRSKILAREFRSTSSLHLSANARPLEFACLERLAAAGQLE